MKYKVGDKVLVRRWDDMKQEFDVDYNGIIQTPYFVFSKKWKHICGTIQEIANVGLTFYMFKGINIRVFTDDMIERKVSEMTKADLKDGMVCKTRDGKIYVVFGDNVINIDSRRYLGDYHHDLTACCSSNDIVEVYTTGGSTFKYMLNVKDYGHLRWKREETKELTVAEIEKLLGYQVKIVKE